MKKLFAFLTLAMLLCVVLPQQADAQLVSTVRPTTAKDSLVNTDNLTIILTPSANDVAGFHVTATRASGTTAGTVILQGSLDGTNWAPVDTITLTNVAYVIATFPITNMPFARYRAVFTTSGTVKLTGVRGHIVRRAGSR
jgi:hypothetical protein